MVYMRPDDYGADGQSEAESQGSIRVYVPLHWNPPAKSPK